MDSKPYFEDDLDALRSTVQQLGGNKVVGAQLWPDKTPTMAARLLADCCNGGRSERLSPSQLLFVMRLACERNCHQLAEYFMAEAGYAKPQPVDPEDEASRLVQKMDEVLQVAGALTERLERLRNRASLRAVGQ